LTEVGAYEAKTNLSRLLERAEKGERITLTRHGRPVAVLAPVGGGRPVGEVIQGLRGFREGRTLGGSGLLRQMIEEGRRF
jgi:prevent-host-death family protein